LNIYRLSFSCPWVTCCQAKSRIFWSIQFQRTFFRFRLFYKIRYFLLKQNVCFIFIYATNVEQLFYSIDNVFHVCTKYMLEKTEGQSIIDNPETIGTLDTQDTWRRQTQHNNTAEKTKKMSNTDTTNNTFLSIVDFVYKHEIRYR
jgi:hypothetical protein